MSTWYHHRWTRPTLTAVSQSAGDDAVKRPFNEERESPRSAVTRPRVPRRRGDAHCGCPVPRGAAEFHVAWEVSESADSFLHWLYTSRDAATRRVLWRYTYMHMAKFDEPEERSGSVHCTSNNGEDFDFDISTKYPSSNLEEAHQTMGAKVSTFKHPKALTDPINHNDPTPQSCIIELLKPECLKVKKGRKKQRSLHPQGKKLTEAKTLTLEKCLLASPSFDQVLSANTDVGEVCVLKPSKVHLSRLGLVDDATLSSKARDCLSFERLANTHAEVEDKCPSEVGNVRRGENGRSRKRVRFRLPQESDIILFCSPGKRLECDEESDAIL
ncbi:hypothetical protein NL676_007571 [Syzygium grande]|nr:hypothetical protein NL676_007571 [Syzygium grande]